MRHPVAVCYDGNKRAGREADHPVYMPLDKLLAM